MSLETPEPKEAKAINPALLFQERPCEKPDSPCAGQGDCGGKGDCHQQKVSWLSGMIHTAFWNGIKLCFDQIEHPPKRILHIGGTRQRDLAQYLALLLPEADIVVLDTDEHQTQKAKEEVCCRFHFVTAALEELPFKDDMFDLTLGHHVFEYAQDWEAAMAEIGRVTTGNFLATVHMPWMWQMLSAFPFFQQAMQQQGLARPNRFEMNTFLAHLNRYSKIKTLIEPWPWRFYMTKMRPVREKTLILQPI